MHENIRMGVTAQKVHCEVDAWIKHATLRWFGLVMKINEDEFMKCVRGQDYRRGYQEGAISEMYQ